MLHIITLSVTVTSLSSFSNTQTMHTYAYIAQPHVMSFDVIVDTLSPSAKIPMQSFTLNREH
jgi:hypothetical protein